MCFELDPDYKPRPDGCIGYKVVNKTDEDTYRPEFATWGTIFRKGVRIRAKLYAQKTYDRHLQTTSARQRYAAFRVFPTKGDALKWGAAFHTIVMVRCYGFVGGTNCAGWGYAAEHWKEIEIMGEVEE